MKLVQKMTKNLQTTKQQLKFINNNTKNCCKTNIIKDNERIC